QGITLGTATDLEGRYTLTVPEGTILVFSFIGFETQRIAVGDRSVIDVVLNEDMASLDEVVVVGYGTQRRKDLTGSIARVTSEDLLQPSAASFDQMLQGKVPGVQISQTSGAPGGNVNILVRGVSSITGGNQPLYVIDGFPIGSGGGGSDMRGYGGALY